MSRKDKDTSALSDRFYEKVFKIKLKGASEIPLDQEFMKAIEQEYATKYLESMSIEPTKANIATILKNNPLKNCTFGAGWNSSGRVADSLTIVARQKKAKGSNDNKAQNLDGEEAKVDAKNEKKEPLKVIEEKSRRPETTGVIGSKYTTKGLNTRSKKIPASLAKYMADLEEEQTNSAEKEYKYPINFDMSTIKTKYLYPFNDTKQKKYYQNLSDDPTTSYLPHIDKVETNEVLNAFKYYFPFSYIKVPSQILKELQTPLKVTLADIQTELRKFAEKFPFDAFPQTKIVEESEHTASSLHTPQESRVTDEALPSAKGRANNLLKHTDIEKCKSMLVSEEMARTVGVMTHFAYWQVFGHLSPVQPELTTKKQMILIAIEQLNILRNKVRNFKLWSLFIMPMLLLAIRMMCEFWLRNKYVGFFEIEKAADIGFEKVNYLINNMFDPNMLYSRFAFFESEIDAVNKKFSDHIQENKYRFKRLYGTTPYLDLYFPKPESDFVRNIKIKKEHNYIIKKDKKPMAQTHASGFGAAKELKENQNNVNDDKEYLQQSYKVKMFQVLLDKVSDNVPESFKGRNGALNYTKKKI